MGRTRDKLEELKNQFREKIESLKEKVEDHFSEHVGRFTADYLYDASMRRVMSMLVHYVYVRDLSDGGMNVAWLMGYSNECAEGYGRDHWDPYPCNASSKELSELGLAFLERRDPHPTLFAPRLAIVLRGTIPYIAADIIEDLRIAAERQRNTHRLRRCLVLCDEVIRRFLEERPGATADQISIAGHSLGAGLAFLIGKHFATDQKRGLYFDTHCFNPPLVTYTSIVSGQAIPNNIFELSERKRLAHGSNQQAITPKSDLRTVWTSLMGNGVTPSPKFQLAVQQTTGSELGIFASTWVRTFGPEALDQEWQEFVALEHWSPNMYLNPSDLVCLQYIKYYEKRQGKANILNVVEPQGIITRLFGKDAKYISNVVPSAKLYISKMFHNNPLLAHSLKQWHKYQELEMQSKMLERFEARLLGGHGHHFRHLAHEAHMFVQRLMSPRSPSPQVYPPPAYPPVHSSAAQYPPPEHAVYPPRADQDHMLQSNYGFRY